MPRPFFSICIPQYNRTSFLVEACRSLAAQTFRDFEVCISDDRSTDGRQGEVADFLSSCGLPFRYHVQPKNTGYDANLRSAIAQARGQYCLLLGNDDALAGPDALGGLKADIDGLGPAGVVITDYEDYATGRPARRIRQTLNWGGGPRVAATHFRNFSFVSGVVLERTRAQALATDKWDGSEMYQTYIGCRMIAEGLPLLELSQSVVRKDIRISGEAVDSYAARARLHPCPIIERRLPLSILGRLVADAVGPFLKDGDRQQIVERILLQLLMFTYPFWLVEYRRVQSWKYAAGVSLGMRPSILTEGLYIGFIRRLRLAAVYGLATAGGLIVPLRVFRSLQDRLYCVAKRAFVEAAA